MKSKFGFTLVEILVALAIVAILAAVGIPAYQNYVTKARVAEGLEFADAGRLRVDVALATGNGLKSGTDLLEVGATKKVDMMTGLNWVQAPPAAPGVSSGNAPLGYVLVGMNLPGQGKRNVFALQRLIDGTWHCVNAAAVGEKDALEEKYLPASCQGAGTTMAKTAPSCPPDQEMVTLQTGPGCTAKCAAGQARDSANPSQCKEVVCGPNEVKHYNTKLCVAIPPKPKCPSGSDAFRTWSNDNDPQWGCFNACPPGMMPGAALKCIPDPNAKAAAPAVASTPQAPAATAVVAPAAKPTAPAAPPPSAAPQGTGRRPGAAALQPITCQVCDPSVPELCELVTVPKVCTYPNNFCITFVDNQDDGTKVVTRDCGNYDRAYTEWFQGTSDNDKCRERIDTEQHLAFTCTFACESDNCNGGLRPAEDSLFQLK